MFAGSQPGAKTLLVDSGQADADRRRDAVPARPPLTRPIVGPATGFALTLEGAGRPGLWVTGDTVLYGGLRRAAAGLEPDVAIVHIGAVKFPLTGPLAYTMDAAAAVELIELASPGIVVPVHVEGWSHFSEQEEAAAAGVRPAPGRGARSDPLAAARRAVEVA